MNDQFYSNILGIPPESSLEDIKRAYRRLAKENHPDFFSREFAEIQMMRMIEINEAYNFLIANRANCKIADVTKKEKEERVFPFHDYDDSEKYTEIWDRWKARNDMYTSDCKEINRHKDPAYAYYKQGFVNYSKGLNGIMAKRQRIKKWDLDFVKNRVIRSLEYFQESHRYFYRVVNEYPDSIWYFDARDKLCRIERFNILYRKILLNLRSRIINTSINQNEYHGDSA